MSSNCFQKYTNIFPVVRLSHPFCDQYLCIWNNADENDADVNSSQL